MAQGQVQGCAIPTAINIWIIGTNPLLNVASEATFYVLGGFSDVQFMALQHGRLGTTAPTKRKYPN